MFNPFKFLWLASEERAELKKLKTEKLKDEEIIRTLVEHAADLTKDPEVLKPYDKLIWTGNTVILVLWDGDVIGPLPCSNDQRLVIKDMWSIDSIINYLTPITPTKNELEEYLTEENIKDALELFRDNKDFEIIGQNIYLSGISVKLPDVIIASFLQVIEQLDRCLWDHNYKEINQEDLLAFYNSLKMFWSWLSLNPIESSRECALNFVKKNFIKLTNNGQLVLYRRANLVKTENKLVDFVSKEYFKIKQWKKAPRNYTVSSKLGDYKLWKNEECPKDDNPYWKNEGNLEQLYLDLPNMENNHLTDSHTRKMTIKVGSVYSIPEDQIDIDSRASCSRGLHAASRHYSMSGFGDTALLVIVNPMHIRSVPIGEEGKMRVSEMFIASTLDIDEEGKYMDDDIDIVQFDEDYSSVKVAELQDILKNREFERLSCQSELPVVPLTDIVNIVEILQNKVVHI